MFKKLILSVLFISTPLLWAANSDTTKTDTKAPLHGFVGTAVCGMCHHTDKQGKQLDIWKESKHAQAYKTLETDEANKIAKEKGFDTPAAKTEACLKCHATGYNVEASLLGPKFKVEDGVQCETCHGGGGDYKTLSVMKNKKEAMEKGLQIHEDMNAFCVTCHNSESPTWTKDSKFDTEAMWSKIKHTIPADK